jgi:hypothetical protein
MTKARSEQHPNSTTRTIGRPFAKGQSGNPGGRPRMPVELRERAQAYGVEALDTLRALMSDASQPGSVRVASASAILDRGYGRPTVSVDVRPKRSLADYTTDELLALAMIAEEDGTTDLPN